MGHSSALFDVPADLPTVDLPTVDLPTMGPAVSHRFSAALREATADVHRQAERTGFIADLIRGRATRAGYVLFLRNLVPVYTALETALDGGADGRTAALSPFADLRLRRLPALLADLEALAGIGWERTYPVLPEADAYALAVASAGRGDGHRLIAHAYARYLGDLSGGQILKPLLARLYDLAPETLTFYDFPALADLGAPKVAMREALDTVPADGAAAVIAEALDAFRHTIALSDAVRREAIHLTPA